MLSSNARRVVVERREAALKKYQEGGCVDAVSRRSLSSVKRQASQQECGVSSARMLRGSKSTISRLSSSSSSCSLGSYGSGIALCRSYVTRERRILSEGFDEPAPMYTMGPKVEKSEYTKVSNGGRDAKKERAALAEDARLFLRGQVPVSTLKAVGEKQLSGGALRIWQRKVGDLENDMVKMGLEVAKDMKSQVLPDLEEEMEFPDWITAYEVLMRAAVYFQHEENNYDVPAMASFDHWNRLVQDAQAKERQRNAEMNEWSQMTSSLHPSSIQEHDMQQALKEEGHSLSNGEHGLSWEQLMSTKAKFLSDAERDFLIHGPAHSIFQNQSLEIKRLSAFLQSIDNGTDAQFLAHDEAQRSQVIHSALALRTESLRHYVSLLDLAETSLVRLYHLQKANAQRAITLQSSEALLQSLLSDPLPPHDADLSSSSSSDASSLSSDAQASLAQFRLNLPRLLPSASPSTSAASTLVQFHPQSLSPEDYTLYKLLEQSLLALEADLTLLTNSPHTSSSLPLLKVEPLTTPSQEPLSERQAKVKASLQQFLTLLLQAELPANEVPSKEIKAIFTATLPLFKYSDAAAKEASGAETKKITSVADALRWTAEDVTLIAQAVRLEERLGVGAGSLVHRDLRKILDPSFLQQLRYPLQPIEIALLSQHTPVSAAQVVAGAQQEVLDSMEIIYANLDESALASLPPHIAQRVRPIPTRFSPAVEEELVDGEEAALEEVENVDELAEVPFTADVEEIEDTLASNKVIAQKKASEEQEMEELVSDPEVADSALLTNEDVFEDVPSPDDSFEPRVRQLDQDLMYLASEGKYAETMNLANTQVYEEMMEERREIYERLMAPHRKDQEVLEKMITFLNDSYDAYPSWFPRRIRSLSSLLEEHDEVVWMQQLGLSNASDVDSFKLTDSSSKRLMTASIVHLAGVFGSTEKEKENVLQELVNQGAMKISGSSASTSSAVSASSASSESTQPWESGLIGDQLPIDGLAKEKLKTIFGSQLSQYMAILNKPLTSHERVSEEEKNVEALEQAREQAKRVMLWTDFSRDQSGSTVTPMSKLFPSASEHPKHQISLKDLVVNPHLRRVMNGLSEKIPNPESWPTSLLKVAGVILPAKGENVDAIAERDPTRPYGQGREVYENQEKFVAPSEASHDASYRPYRHPSKGVGNVSDKGPQYQVAGGDFGFKVNDDDIAQLRTLLPDLASDLDVLAAQGHEDPTVAQRKFVQEYIEKHLSLETASAQAVTLSSYLFGPQRRAIPHEQRRRVHRTQQYLADLAEKFEQGSLTIPIFQESKENMTFYADDTAALESASDPIKRISPSTKVGFNIVTKELTHVITSEDTSRMKQWMPHLDVNELAAVMRINDLVSGRPLPLAPGDQFDSRRLMVSQHATPDSLTPSFNQQIAEYEKQNDLNDLLLASAKRHYRATRDTHRKERLIDIRLAAIEEMIEAQSMAFLEPLMSVRHKQLLDKILASKKEEDAQETAKSEVAALYESEYLQKQKNRSLVRQLESLESNLSQILTLEEEQEFARLNAELQEKLESQMEKQVLEGKMNAAEAQRQAYVKALLEDIELYSRDLAGEARDADVHVTEVDAAEKIFLSSIDPDFTNPLAERRRQFIATVLRGGDAWTRSLIVSMDTDELLKGILKNDTTSTPSSESEVDVRLLLSLPLPILYAAIDQVMHAARRATEGLDPLNAQIPGQTFFPHSQRLSSRLASIAKIDAESLGGKSPSEMTLSQLINHAERIVQSAEGGSNSSTSTSSSDKSQILASIDEIIKNEDSAFVSKSSAIQDALFKKHKDEIEYNIEYGISQEEADAKKAKIPKPDYGINSDRLFDTIAPLKDDPQLDAFIQEKLASSKMLSGDAGLEGTFKGDSLSLISSPSLSPLASSPSSSVDRASHGMIVKTEDLVLDPNHLVDSLVASSSSSLPATAAAASPMTNPDGSKSAVGLARHLVSKTTSSTYPSSLEDPMFGVDINAPVMKDAYEQVLLEDAIAGKKVYGDDPLSPVESRLSKTNPKGPVSEFDERYPDVIREMEQGEEVSTVHPLLRMDASNLREVSAYIATMPEWLMGEDSVLMKEWKSAAEMEEEYPQLAKDQGFGNEASSYIAFIRMHRENMKSASSATVLGGSEGSDKKALSDALKYSQIPESHRQQAVHSLFNPKDGESAKTLLALSHYGNVEETIKIGESLLSIFNHPKSSQDVKDIAANTLHIISHPAFFGGDVKKASEVKSRLPIPKTSVSGALTPDLEALEKQLNDPDGELVQILHYLVNKGEIPESEKTAAMRLFEESIARGPSEQRQYEAWMRSLLKKGDVARLSRELARLGIFEQKPYKEAMENFNAWRQQMMEETRKFNAVIDGALQMLRDPAHRNGGHAAVALGDRIAVHEAHLKTDWEILKQAGLTSGSENVLSALGENSVEISEKFGNLSGERVRLTSSDGKMLWTRGVEEKSAMRYFVDPESGWEYGVDLEMKRAVEGLNRSADQRLAYSMMASGAVVAGGAEDVGGVVQGLLGECTKEELEAIVEESGAKEGSAAYGRRVKDLEDQAKYEKLHLTALRDLQPVDLSAPPRPQPLPGHTIDDAPVLMEYMARASALGQEGQEEAKTPLERQVVWRTPGADSGKSFMNAYHAMLEKKVDALPALGEEWTLSDPNDSAIFHWTHFSRYQEGAIVLQIDPASFTHDGLHFEVERVLCILPDAKKLFLSEKVLNKFDVTPHSESDQQAWLNTQAALDPQRELSRLLQSYDDSQASQSSIPFLSDSDLNSHLQSNLVSSSNVIDPKLAEMLHSHNRGELNVNNTDADINLELNKPSYPFLRQRVFDIPHNLLLSLKRVKWPAPQDPRNQEHKGIFYGDQQALADGKVPLSQIPGDTIPATDPDQHIQYLNDWINDATERLKRAAKEQQGSL